MDARTGAGLLLLGLGAVVAGVWLLQPEVGAGTEPVQEALTAVLPESATVSLPEPSVEVQRIKTPMGGDVTAVRFASRGGYVAVSQQHADGDERLFMGHISKLGITRVVEVLPETPVPEARLGGAAWMKAPILLQHHTCDAGGGCVLGRMAASPGARSRPLLSDAKTPPTRDMHPSPSPDAAVLAWIGDGDVWSWRRGDDGPVRHTEVGGVQPPLMWSSDERLAFSQGEPGARRIGVLDVPGNEVTWSVGGDRRGPAFDASGRLWWYRSAGVGQPYSLVHETSAGPFVVAEDVRLPLLGAVSLSERGDHVAWTTWDEASAGRVSIQRLTDGERFFVDVGQHHVGDLALAQGFGQMWLGFAGLPPGVTSRRASLADITAIVGEQAVIGTVIGGAP